MGWCEGESVCRNHPNEIPQPGICPSCLRDRLSAIGNGNSRIINKNSSPNYSFPTSPVYYYYNFSSASSSGGSSPCRRRRHQRVASDVIDSIYAAISGTHGLKKSRSMAYAPRINGELRDNNHSKKKKKKKGGFWNKLMLRYSLKKV